MFYQTLSSPKRNPTPPGVTIREGIPNWPAYTEEKKEFMAIDRYWNVRNDYSLVFDFILQNL